MKYSASKDLEIYNQVSDSLGTFCENYLRSAGRMRTDLVYAKYQKFCSKQGMESVPKWMFKDYIKKQYDCKSNGHYLEGVFFLAPKFAADIEGGPEYVEPEPKSLCDECQNEDITSFHEGRRLCDKCLTEMLVAE